MTKTLRRLALSAGVLAMPALLMAQAPRAPRDPAGPMAARTPAPSEVTRILNARRQLDLTPRQVAQLDSIERGVFAERRAMQQRLQAQRDSLRGDVAGRARAGQRVDRDSVRARAQARMEALRPQMEQLRRRDSVARSAAERVLNDAQRQQYREMRAERRGYERGLRAGRGAADVRRAMPQRGARPAPPRMAPRGEGPQAGEARPGMRQPMMRRPMAPPTRPDDELN